MEESNVRVHNVGEREFDVSFACHNRTLSDEQQVHHAHNAACAFLVALNAGSLGTFYWQAEPWAHPVLRIADDLAGTNSRAAALVVQSDNAYEKLTPITEQGLCNTALIFGIVARKLSKVLTGEYCRGLVLLQLNFYDLNLRREAFLCFYRALDISLPCASLA